MAIGAAGALLVAGAWDNLNSIDRTLRDGYEARATVTGSDHYAGTPLVLDDGWRPRFLDQSTWLHLTWTAHDGQPQRRRNVPVTDDLAMRILLGNQIQMPEIQVKVIDEGNAIPVVLADADQRRADLRNLLRLGSFMTIAALCGLAGVAIAGALRRQRSDAAAIGQPISNSAPPLQRSARHFSVKLAVFSIFSLFGGCLLLHGVWTDHSDRSALRTRGLSAEAQVLEAYSGSSGGSARIQYLIVLGWSDPSGKDRRFGPQRISEQLYRAIHAGRRTVEICYLPGDESVRPIIVGEEEVSAANAKLGIYLGVPLLLVSLVGNGWWMRRVLFG